MPFFDENPITPGRIGARLWRAGRQNRQARRIRTGGPGVDPGDAAGRDDVRTTVDATIRPVGRGPYRRLAWTAGEPHRVRDDLGARPEPSRVAHRRSLVYFAQHTDLHLVDAQAEARLVGAQGLAWVHPGADASHRPQETMTTQVFDQIIRATNRITTSPVSGAPMAWCAQTGDHTDNRTTAAAHWWLDVLAGRRVTPDTGAQGRYQGVQRSGWPTVWNPDVAGRDRPQRNGFPYLPGVLDAALAPFDTAGLDVAWLTLLGNHDELFTGMFGSGHGLGIDALEDLVRASGRAPVTTGALIGALIATRLPGDRRARWRRRRTGTGVVDVVPAPDARRPMTTTAWLQMILDDPAGHGPRGHGFTPAHVVDRAWWWSRPGGDQVQVIGLDTNNHTHGEQGRVGPRQTAWLETELARHHTRYRGPDGAWVPGTGPDRLIVVLSHHNSWVMEAGADDEMDPGPALDGEGLVALLGRFPNVVLWCNGHSHQHRIAAHRTGPDGSGFWEVSSASVVGWPQQGRTHELFDNADGTVSILTTVFDHAAPPVPDRATQGEWTPRRLASLSRELSVNDNRWLDPMDALGGVADRNVELVVAAPRWLTPRGGHRLDR